jgi:hypothetical protein
MRALENDSIQPILAFPLPRTLNSKAIESLFLGNRLSQNLDPGLMIYPGPYTRPSRRLKSTPSHSLNMTALPLVLFIN